MALWVQLAASHAVTADAAGQQVISREGQQIADNTSVLYADSGQRSIPPLANVQLIVDGVTTARFISLAADGALNVRFGANDADPVAMAPMATGQRAIYQATQTFTSVWIENPSAATSVSLRWAVGGV